MRKPRAPSRHSVPEAGTSSGLGTAARRPRRSRAQVLRWFGYFTEEVPDSRIENCRIRKVVIRFYLDNDTLDVLEPRQTNSGIDQVGPAAGRCLLCALPRAVCHGQHAGCGRAPRISMMVRVSLSAHETLMTANGTCGSADHAVF